VSTSSVQATPAEHARGHAVLTVALGALPVVGLTLGVLTFYCIEAWTRKTPWVFTDELEWTQISRAIEETGHAARRGEPIGFKSLYAVMIAPFWAIHSTATAYAAIKYLNVIVMSLAAVPTFFLARMLLPKRTSVVVAILAVFIPGMAYATSLVPEVVAYPWYALCSWLIVRALASRRPFDFAWAGLASIVALLVRYPQFATVPATFAIAGATLWVIGPRGRAWRANWSRGDTVGAIVLLVGGLILFNRIMLQHIEIWQISTQYWKGRMVDLGLGAALAFVVGMGVLPVIGGIASLHLRERRGDPVYRAFAAYLGASILCISLYTAVKAAYLSTVTLTVTEERNMIYLAPLMLIGTALVLRSREIDWLFVAVTTVFIVYLIFEKPLQLLYPYFEAPGFSILTIPNRHWGWATDDLHLLLIAVLAISVLILVLRNVPGVPVVAGVLVGAWMLTAQIAATTGFDNFANRLLGNMPAQLDWVDQATGRQPVTYLGQKITDPNGLWLTEFWNRSIQHVYSLDATAPGPGPAYTPSIVRPDGELSNMPDTNYVLADQGVRLQAPVVNPGGRWGQLTLYRGHSPWKLLDAAQQLYADGWAPGESAYTYFRPGQRGTLEVTLSRTGFNGPAPAGRARLVVGTVRIDPDQGVPVLDRVVLRRRALVRNGTSQTLKIPVERTPVRVELSISPTFQASAADRRELGAQVGFRFVPERPK
jgi:hypothetical protein